MPEIKTIFKQNKIKFWEKHFKKSQKNKISTLTTETNVAALSEFKFVSSLLAAATNIWLVNFVVVDDKLFNSSSAFAGTIND